jgi:hypothetical protein
MAYFGYIDLIQNNVVSGWAADSEKPNESVTVEVFVANAPAIIATADIYRDDLQKAGVGNGYHGFEIAYAGQQPAARIRVRIRGTDFYLQNDAARAAKIHTERLYNSTIDGAPNLALGFTERSPGAADQSVAAEIIARWRRSSFEQGPTTPRKSDMWDHHVANGHEPLLTLIEANDAAALARYLCRIPIETVGEGVLQGDRAYRDLVATTDSGRNNSALVIQDSLVSLAQYLGVARLETTEQGPFGQAILADPEKLEDAIASAIGVPIVTPAVFHGLFGMRIGGGFIETRGLQALYAALRIKSILGASRPGQDVFSDAVRSRICEIGAGFGLAAYFSCQLGVKHYTIVDLPSMLMMQHYFLRMAMPDVTIKTLKDDEPIPSADGVYLVTAASFPRRKAERFDLVMNCDSFPEMGDKICKSYFDAIAERSRLLFSINQEANGPLSNNVNGPRQPVVSEMIGRRSDFTSVYRFRTWIRKGYAEELWRTRAATTP